MKRLMLDTKRPCGVCGFGDTPRLAARLISIAIGTMRILKNMEIKDIKDAIRSIGIALHSTHNTVTTDVVGVEPNETSWCIDNSKETKLLDELEELLLSNTGTCPLCGKQRNN